MKQRHWYLLLPLALVASAYWVWSGRAAHELGPGSPPLTNRAAPAAIAEVEAPGSLPPQAARSETAQQSGDGDCEIVTHYLPRGDGTVFEAVSCEPLVEETRHPYESYSDAELESLVYADAKAAEILGMRLREQDEVRAMSLTLRASALAGGDIKPILAFSNAYPHATSVNNVPVRKAVYTRFILAEVADLLGDGTDYTAAWEARIRQYSTDPELELALLRDKARRIVAEMRQIQLDVTGTSTIGGPDDA